MLGRPLWLQETCLAYGSASSVVHVVLVRVLVRVFTGALQVGGKKIYARLSTSAYSC